MLLLTHQIITLSIILSFVNSSQVEHVKIDHRKLVDSLKYRDQSNINSNYGIKDRAEIREWNCNHRKHQHHPVTSTDFWQDHCKQDNHNYFVKVELQESPWQLYHSQKNLFCFQQQVGDNLVNIIEWFSRGYTRSHRRWSWCWSRMSTTCKLGARVMKLSCNMYIYTMYSTRQHTVLVIGSTHALC